MRKILILITYFLLANSILFGQKTTDKLTSKFFNKYKLNSDYAFDYIFGTNKWMKENKDPIEKVKFQIREYANLMGDYVGYEELSEKTVGKSIKVCFYLVKYDRQPILFIFRFYKAKDSWTLFDLKFDNEIDKQLDRFMK